jgi:hypothetical protein
VGPRLRIAFRAVWLLDVTLFRRRVLTGFAPALERRFIAFP